MEASAEELGPDEALEPTAAEALAAAKAAMDAPAAADTQNQFWVQVAAHKHEADAETEAQSLVERGLKAETQPKGSGSSWHRVQLGPFQTRVQAEAERLKLDVNRRRQAYVLPRSNGKFHVQVGSFSTREQAEPVAERLESLGHATKISRVRMGEQRWHCVRVGPFDSHAEALGYQGLLPEIPGTESRVIPFMAAAK